MFIDLKYIGSLQSIPGRSAQLYIHYIVYEGFSNAKTQRVSACSSLVLYGIRDRWLPCTERSHYRAQFLGSNLDIEVDNSVPDMR